MLWLVDEGLVYVRILNKGHKELQNGEYTLPIILGAMAVESYLSYVFIKWKTIYIEASEATRQEGTWEEELRRKYRLTDRLDMVCEFLTQKRFDVFANDDEVVKKLLDERHPESKSYAPIKFFEEGLFRKRNRIIHQGKIDSTKTEAFTCYNVASTLTEIIKRMDALRFQRL
jgi:hypothetical protein